jgi:hypothetical protein
MNKNTRIPHYDETTKLDLMNPFAMNGCVELSKHRWGLDLLEKRYSIKGEGPPYLDVTSFVNQKGKIQLPLWTSYYAIHFKPSATKQNYRISRQWIELATMLASDMKEMGIAGPITLPPQISDVRPWQWMGFKTTVKYTYYIDLPFALAQADRTVKANVNKALNAGYTCSTSNVTSHILECLAETEDRSNFSYKLDFETLELARRLLGDEYFRSYVCYAPDGEPVSSSIVLYSPGGLAADWVTGTKTKHLKAGVAQLTYHHRLIDLWQAGCMVLDMIGANMQSVARMKATWGGRLVPYYVIEPYDAKALSAWLKQWVKQKYFV